MYGCWFIPSDLRNRPTGNRGMLVLPDSYLIFCNCIKKD
nr:MAG TPA: hypothetical protein [Caudoviricetes sp.]